MNINPIAKIRRFFHFKKTSDSWNLERKYVDLYTTFNKINPDEKKQEKYSELIEKVEVLFKAEKNWENVKLIEQFLVPLFDENELAIEIKIKLLAGKRKFPEDLYQFYHSEIESADHKSKRELLSNLNKDLYRIYDQQSLSRDYIAKTRIRTSLFFILSIVMFFMIDQLIFIRELLDVEIGSKGDFLVTAMAAGWMGTSFSILTGLGNRIQHSSSFDLKIIHRIDYILSRALIGMISGLMLFYAFHSGILTGTFFPEFNVLLPILDDPNKALLILWCFISGFSEKLVPDLLSKVEKSANGNEE